MPVYCRPGEDGVRVPGVRVSSLSHGYRGSRWCFSLFAYLYIYAFLTFSFFYLAVAFCGLGKDKVTRPARARCAGVLAFTRLKGQSLVCLGPLAYLLIYACFCFGVSYLFIA